jgi:hypothetical protein
MSTFSQSIPNFLSGVSQQPDNRKRPGQVKEAVNVYPDFALGMLKRPGSKFISTLFNATTVGSSKWFPILRDSSEKYVAQFDGFKFKIWDLSTGLVQIVDHGDGCTATTERDAYITEVNNLGTAYTTLRNAEDQYRLTLNEGVDNIYEVDVEYQYPATGTIANAVTCVTYDGTNYRFYKGDTLPFNTVTTSTHTANGYNYSLGTERTDDHPLLAQGGIKVYELREQKDAPSTSTDQASIVTALSTYQAALSLRDGARTAYQNAVNSCGPSSVSYLMGTQSKDDIDVLTLNDTTFVLNKSKTVLMKSSPLSNASGHDADKEAFVVVTVNPASGNFNIELEWDSGDPVHTQTATLSATPGGDITATLTAIQTQITNQNSPTVTYTAPDVDPEFTCNIVGSVLHVLSTKTFRIKITHANPTNVYVIRDTVTNETKLPNFCKNGTVLQIVNTSNVDYDDWYVKFTTDDGSDFGEGKWKETVASGLEYQIDASTMPHKLVREANGTFTLSEVEWDNRNIGDDNTNPLPSFVGKKLRSIFFYRNRLGLLADDAVNLSRAGDFYNFFATSAQVATDDDPIDISASGSRPTILHHVLPTSVGLVLYAVNDQFLLTTDSDILSPKTCKINRLSSYECEQNVKPVSLGTTHAFLSKSNLYSKMFELVQISNDRSPVMNDPSVVVPEYLPSTIDQFITSPSLSTVSLGTTGQKDLYQFKFLNRGGEERVVASWFKWTLPGELLCQFFDESTLYVVTLNNNEVHLCRHDLSQSNESGFLRLTTGESTDVCLDEYLINPHRTGAGPTKVYLPFSYRSDSTVVVLDVGGNRNSLPTAADQTGGKVHEFTSVSNDTTGDYVLVDEDLQGKNLIIGTLYDMQVELPKFYKFSASGDSVDVDDSADLIMHRYKLKLGLSGPISVAVGILGISDRTSDNNIVYKLQRLLTNNTSVTVSHPDNTTFTVDSSVLLPNQYRLNSVNMLPQSTHTIPIFQRNENLNVSIKSSTPFPVSLLGMEWEGKYNRRFYRRG